MARNGRKIPDQELINWISEFDYDKDEMLNFKEFKNMMLQNQNDT